MGTIRTRPAYQRQPIHQSTLSPRHNLKTGAQIPAIILAEIDRKVDDGVASTGSFRFSAHTGFTATPPTAANCYTVATGAWIIIGAIETNCGGTNLF